MWNIHDNAKWRLIYSFFRLQVGALLCSSLFAWRSSYVMSFTNDDELVVGVSLCTLSDCMCFCRCLCSSSSVWSVVICSSCMSPVRTVKLLGKARGDTPICDPKPVWTAPLPSHRNSSPSRALFGKIGSIFLALLTSKVVCVVILKITRASNTSVVQLS